MSNFNVKKIIQITLLIIVISIGFAFIVAKIQGINLLEKSKQVTVSKGNGSINEIKEFDIVPISKVMVDTVSSDVNIILWKGDKIKVHFYGTASDLSRAPKLETSLSRDKLDISIKYPNQITSIFNFNLNTKLDLYIPEKYKKSMDIETVSGEINIDKLEADNFDVSSTSGDVNINSIVANITDFESVSGTINIKSLSAKANGFETTSGDIKIEAINGDISANSVSGSITASYNTFNNEVAAETVSGDVDLILPKTSEFMVDFSSTSGELDNDFHLVVKGKVEKQNIKGTVGNGKKTIRVETISGDAVINKK
ncbi:DUF4097 domain-containing protein [Clostridium bowmanii]|uniref:DUF4097 family beta strand repeat-containing protein n=1 Tax=Clostridium bowmanii TaxID=132925 RepID=UPI001C0DF8CB|nr:DUF4097 family beta strand repeat-containing protein [Clostridium bowmanii]MBU3190100.1 DUF4097 domain-containing protein [Clostridium bowmanii]MCA1074695.1 DUF4097 domain-containing protein [Clostridium bowmanii]